jgi:hypothetical protein
MAHDELLPIENSEHDLNNGVHTKKVSIFGYDQNANTPRRVAVDANGVLKTAGFDASANLTITESTVGTVTTTVITDGVKTLTVSEDTSNSTTTTVWS